MLPEPQLPDGASFPAPVTEPQKDAVTSFGEFVQRYSDWAKQGWGRAADAKEFCDHV